MSHELVEHLGQYIDAAEQAGNKPGARFLGEIQRRVEVGVRLGLVPTLPDALPTATLGIEGSELTEEEMEILGPKIEQIRELDGIEYLSTANILALFSDLRKEELYVWERKEFIHPKHMGARFGGRSFRAYGPKDALLIGFLWVFSSRRGLKNKIAIELARGALERIVAPENEPEIPEVLRTEITVGAPAVVAN